MNILATILISLVAIGGSLFGAKHLDDGVVQQIEQVEEKVQQIENSPLSGAFSPSGGLTYRLQTSLATTDTTIVLSSFKNRSDIPLTMSLLGTDVVYGTLSPQTTRSEFVSCTGVTQNSNGTASLTGCTRGLSDIGASAASTTLRRSHPGQSVFILSDSPALFNEYAKLRTNETISGSWDFTGNPTLDTDCTVGSANDEICAKAYIDGVAVAGASNANTTTKGIVEIATATENASSTTTGGTGATLVPPSSTASSSPKRSCKDGGSTAGELCIVVAKNNGKIEQTYLDLTENTAWSGTNTHSGLESFSATSTFATTTHNGAMFGANIANTFTGYETISGASAPKAVMMATTTTAGAKISMIESDVASTTGPFLGFVINNCALNTTCYVQTDGIVKGFSGLTPGSEYYVSDTAGTISTTVGTSENYVGRAVAADQIQIDKTRGMQYLGSQSLTTSAATVVNQPWARIAVIRYSFNDGTARCGNGGTITLTKLGQTTASAISPVDSAGGGYTSCNSDYTWSGGTITNSIGTVGSQTATAFYYK